MNQETALITNDATVLGILAVILGLVFYTQNSNIGFFKKFYQYVPALLLCYFIPSIFNSTGIISGAESNLYFAASRYLLPASLILLTLSIDLKAIIGLGPKALIMFFTATLGIVIGGPLALLVMLWLSPETLASTGDGEEVWRGLTTVAGSWIGGGANQAAMKEVYQVGDSLFSAMVTVDVLVANVWLAVLLFMAGRSKIIDEKLGADTNAIDRLKEKMQNFHLENSRVPQLNEFMILVAIAFGLTGLAHFGADTIAPFVSANYPALADASLGSKFFWLIVIATTGGVLLSFTRARQLEGAGASKIGSVFIYILVATIGMKMDVTAIFDKPGLFILGLIWMAFHAGLLITVGRIIKAPTFFLAVGSQANVGGAASAPVVASAFHPALAPVGVLLAVLGYALGTYAVLLLCGPMLQWIGN